MKKNLLLVIGVFLLLGQSFSFAQTPSEAQNLHVFSASNTDAAITAKTIEKAFNESGLKVDVNNNMNSIFEKRYEKVHHKAYNLAIFTSDKMILKLIGKYPDIGLITPLSMSIYENDAKTIHISTLSLAGMARITHIPITNPDLIAYAKLIDNALHKALPKGKYLPVAHSVKAIDTLVTSFEIEFELEDGATYIDAKEEFVEEFEGELGPVGFLVPKSYHLQEDLLKAHKQNDYDFYDTYSIIRFNAIFPVSKNHPDAGAYAPFSLAIYKKKDEDTVHIKFPSITNWIVDLGVSEEEAVNEVQKTHAMLKTILEELTE